MKASSLANMSRANSSSSIPSVVIGGVDLSEVTAHDRTVLRLWRSRCAMSGRIQPKMKWDGTKSRDINDAERVSKEVFCLLFKQDLCFGGFGIPVPQFDNYLNIASLTAFQPHSADMFREEADVILVLTPIYRILAGLAAIAMEALRLIPSAERALPYCPRDGFASQRYLSLSHMVESVWYDICHAYVHIETRLVKSVHCFKNGAKMPHIWLDVDLSSFVQYRANSHMRSRERFESVSGPFIRLLDCRGLTLENVTIVIDELLVISYNLSSKRTTEKRYLGHTESPPIDAIWFRTLEEGGCEDTESLVGVCKGLEGQRCAFYLMLTCDDGNYNAFYRNSSAKGDLVVFPLFVHPHLPSDDEFLFSAK